MVTETMSMFSGESFLLDTNTIIEALSMDPSVRNFLLEEGKKGASFEVSVISECEVLSGMLEQEKEKTLQFFNSKESIAVDRILARLAGDLRREKKVEGRVCKTPDALLAATCLTKGLILVSKDKKLLRFAQSCGVKINDLNL